MTTLPALDTTAAHRVAGLLIARKQTLAVSESSTGGLVSAMLLSMPGASACFLGGGVVYTGAARAGLLGVTAEKMAGIRSATPEMSRLLAETVRTRLGADWGLAETGATGPTGNRYGDAPGHCCLAVAGPRSMSRVLATGDADRARNMVVFAAAAFALLEEALTAA
ncbi:MAG: CinA family protein [Alphaproteobacteria bacterium]